jgi:hypothetical protein
MSRKEGKAASRCFLEWFAPTESPEAMKMPAQPLTTVGALRLGGYSNPC